MPPTPYDELQRLASESGVEKVLDFLEHHFRRDQEYFKLFEVLKMRCRNRMKLPLIYSQQPDDLDDEQQRQLEDGLLNACRDVGTLFMKAGKLQEGWMYLQPVGDKSLNEKLIRSVVPDEENIDSIIEVAISQGAAPVYGYRLLLKHYGTCNGITTFDTQAGRFDRPVQAAMAQALLLHLYEELVGNVKYAIAQSSPSSAIEVGATDDEPTPSLAELRQSHSGLTENGAHHIDTTHLASLMRIARFLDDSNDIRMALELAKYGSGLANDFQYAGSPPFENTYVDHQFFFEALMGDNIDAAIAHFEDKTKTVDVSEFGPVAIETLIDLLVRVGRNKQAISVLTEQLLGQHEPLGIAPSPIEIANSKAELVHLMNFYQSQGDLLGYAVSLLKNV